VRRSRHAERDDERHEARPDPDPLHETCSPSGRPPVARQYKHGLPRKAQLGVGCSPKEGLWAEPDATLADVAHCASSRAESRFVPHFQAAPTSRVALYGGGIGVGFTTAAQREPVTP
jgi:hypothetical protein